MEDEVCIICLEKGNLFKKLYHLPCNCNYYIHKKCSKNIDKNVCLICKNNYLNKEDINIQVINKHNKQVVYLNEKDDYIKNNKKCCKFNFDNDYSFLKFNCYILLFGIIFIHMLFFVGFVFSSILSNEPVFFYDMMNIAIGTIISLFLLYCTKPCIDDET